MKPEELIGRPIRVRFTLNGKPDTIRAGIITACDPETGYGTVSVEGFVFQFPIGELRV